MFSMPPPERVFQNSQFPASEVENSPEEAFAHALTIRDSASRSVLLRQVSKRFLDERSDPGKALECIDRIEDPFDKGYALKLVNAFYLTPEHQNLGKALEIALQISHPLAKSMAFDNLSAFYLAPEHQNLEKSLEFALRISDDKLQSSALWKVCEFHLNLKIPDPIKALGYTVFMRDDFEKYIAFSRLSTFCKEHGQLHLSDLILEKAKELQRSFQQMRH